MLVCPPLDQLRKDWLRPRRQRQVKEEGEEEAEMGRVGRGIGGNSQKPSIGKQCSMHLHELVTIHHV